MDTHTIWKNNIVKLKKPDVFVNNPITELVRNGARKILAKALEVEISIFINQYKDLFGKDAPGLSAATKRSAD